MFPITIWAQELEFVDLGVVEGEFKQLQKELKWVNSTGKDLSLTLISEDSKIQIINKQVQVIQSDTLLIPFNLTLPPTPGYYEYEIQLVGSNDILLHGYHLGLQVLASEIDVFKAYRNVYWPFRAKEQVFNLRAGYKEDTLSATFEVYNFGGENLKLDDITINDSTWVTFEPKEIKHNQFGHMTLRMYNSTKATSGFQKMNLELKKEGNTFSNLPVQFTVMPKKQFVDAELVSGGPALTASSINHDFKEVEEGKIESTIITLANVGNEDLMIEKLESNCDCLTFDIQKTTLSSGETQSLYINFNAQGRRGLERKTLAIFSNDPNNPTLVITFRAYVK